ncbi:MAG TPA: sensor histidine kinase [Cytophagales bacterium]|nr:sensor histidine kinase [Cytophagales bacterium]
MKIRNKIALIYTTITATLFLTVFISIFYFANQYKEKEFYQRLRERANIAAQTLLEEDEVNASIYNEIRDKHLQALPDERELIIPVEELNVKNNLDYATDLSPEFIDEILRNGYAESENIDFYSVGIFYDDNQGDFIVVISATDKYGAAKLDNLNKTMFVAFLASLGVIFIVGIYYSHQVLKPISTITKEVNNIRASNLHLRLPAVGKKDELVELAITFNNMLDRLETSFEIQSNFVSNASHELKNPLTVILGEAEVALKKERSSMEYVQALSTIEKEAQRLDYLVDSLLRMAQTEYDNKGLIIEEIRIDELVIDVKEDAIKHFPNNKISLDLDGLPEEEEQIIIQGNRSLIRMVLSNIIGNACKFSENKEVKIKLSATQRDISIVITDQGVGIPDNELKNIYEPFFRASNVRSFKGFGIGLPMAQKIIRIHGGQLVVHSTEGIGTIATITLPNARQAVSIAR